MLRSSFIVASLVIQAGAVAAPPLQPSGKWTVDYAPSRCAASRPFGEGKDPLTLTIVPAHTGGSTRLVLSNAWKQLTGVDHTASIDFSDGAPAFRTDAMPALTFGPSRAVVIVDLPPEQTARLRKSQAIKFVSGTIADHSMALGSTASLFEALDKCIADLKGYWAIGTSRATAAAPTKDLGNLFSWSNYPTVGERRAKTNTVTARLLVDEKGNVRDCLVTSGTGSTAIDVQTCQVLEHRLPFHAAMDTNGTPVRSVVDMTVKWHR